MRSKSGGFGLAPELLSLSGCSHVELAEILTTLGYTSKGDDKNMSKKILENAEITNLKKIIGLQADKKYKDTI